MGFKTWAAGDVLTAADVNDYLMEQAVIVCTSGTRPSSPGEGMTIYETDTNRIMVYDGSAWYCPYDPGWSTLTLDATYAADTTNGYTPGYRMIGNNTVELCGTVKKAAGGNFTAGASITVVTNVPAGIVPASSVYWVGISQFGAAGSPIVRWQVYPDGHMTALPIITASWLDLTGFRYRLS